MKTRLRRPFARLSASVLAALLALPALILPAAGQAGDGKARPPAAESAATVGPGASAAGSLEPVPASPEAGPASPPGAQDSLNQPKSRADTVLVVQHSFNHRQQIITGSVVMSCLALMLVIMNNYNPR